MPKRQHPEPTPLAAIVAELVARAERGPPPAWKPEPGAAVACYRPPRFAPHPGQLEIPFDEAKPSPASADSAICHSTA
jgi:hypothetical protein